MGGKGNATMDNKVYNAVATSLFTAHDITRDGLKIVCICTSCYKKTIFMCLEIPSSKFPELNSSTLSNAHQVCPGEVRQRGSSRIFWDYQVSNMNSHPQLKKPLECSISNNIGSYGSQSTVYINYNLYFFMLSCV